MTFPQVGVEAVVEGVNSFLRNMGKMDSAIQSTADRASSSGNKIGQIGSKFASLGKAAAAAAVTGVVALGAAVAGIGVVSLKTAIDFESAWAGVVKTTDGLVDKFGNLTEAGEEMQTQFRDLAKVVPIAVEELLEIGELGGQLGVASEDLIGFTEVIAAMGVSTNLSTDEAATGLARLANVMGTVESEGSAAFSKLGSTIVALGNNSATTEADILNFASRMAGAAAVAGVTEADMLGISAAFSSVGIQAQAGGTAVSKVFLEMNKAALEGGAEMEIFAAVAGLSADEFGAAWEQDAGAVFGEFVQGLGLAGDDAVAILDALEIKDSQAVRAFLSLAGAGDLVTESMLTANEGWDANTALANEAATRYATTESQLILLKNTIKDIAITIGNALLPAFSNIISAITSLIRFFADVAETGDSMNDFLADMPNSIKPIAKAMADFGIKVVATFKKEIPKAIAATQNFITGSLLPAFQQFGQFILTQVVPAIISFIQAAASFAQEHGPAIRNVIIAIGAAFAAASIISTIAGIIASIIALFNPITLVIGVIALLVAAWTENWFGIRDVITSVINNAIIPAFQAIMDFVIGSLIPALLSFGEFLIGVLTPIVQAYANFMIAVFSAIRDWVVANWPLIQQTIQTVVTAIQTVVQAALGAVLAFWEQNGAAIMTTVSQAWTVVKSLITAAITLISGTIKAVMQAINGDWSGAWETIQETADTAMEIMETGIEAAMEIIKTLIQIALAAIEAAFALAWTGIQLAVSTAMTAIQTVVETVLGAIKTAFGDGMDFIQTKAQEVWDAIGPIFQDGLDKAKGVLDSILPAFQDAGGALIEAIKNGILAAAGDLQGAVSGVLDGVADLLPFSEPKNPRSPLRNLAKSGVAIVDNISAGLADAMPVLQAQLNAAITPSQSPAPASSISNVTGDTINIDIVSNPASQPSEQAIAFDLAAGLAAARVG